MVMDNIYDLIMGKAPDAQMTAQNMAQAIRGKRSAQKLYALGASDVPAALNKVYGEQAGADEEMLTKGALGRAQYGEEQRALKQTLAGLKTENDLQKALIGAGARMYGADAGADARMFAATLAAQAQGDRRAEAQDKVREGYVQKFAKDIEFIEKMPDDINQLKSVAAKSDVPGYGPVAGYLPNWLISDQGVATRQAGGRLINALLYMQSGKAVSAQEAERQFLARGLSKGSTPAAFRQGVEELEKELRTAYKSYVAKYPQDAVSLFQQRGGGASLAGFDQGPTIGGGGGQSGTVTVMWKGKAKVIPESKLAEALAAGATQVK